MEVSRRVVHEHWWSIFALVIVLALVALLRLPRYVAWAK